MKNSKAYKDRMKAYVEAKAALLHANLGPDSGEDSNTDGEDDTSNASGDTEYMDDEDSNIS
jgi:hypothetical protein